MNCQGRTRDRGHDSFRVIRAEAIWIDCMVYIELAILNISSLHEQLNNCTGRLWTTYHCAIELLFFVPCSRGQKRNDARARKPGRCASRDEQKGHAKLDKKKSIDEDDAIRTHDPKD